MNRSSASLPTEQPRSRSDWCWLTLLLVGFAVSRWISYQQGTHASLVGGLPQMQIADRDLLRSDLLGTLFYLHIQPPLFNGLVGLLLKTAGSRFVLAVTWLYWAFGALMTVTLYRLLRKFGLRGLSASLATLLFMISPAAILYETFTIYTYPTALLLLATTLFAYRLLESGRRTDALATSLLIAAVALTRSLFHLIWVTGAIVILLLLQRKPRRIAPFLALPAFLLVSLLYLKNWVVFDMFGASSLLGLNLNKVATSLLAPEDRLRLVESAILSPYALINPHRPVAHFPIRRKIVDRVDFSAWADRSLLPAGWWKKTEKSRQTGEFFLWNDGQRSVLLVPMLRADSLLVQIRCEPFDYPGSPPQTIRVRSSGQEVTSLALREGVAEYRFEVPADLLRPGLNVLTFEYAYARRPKALGLSQDSRRLAVRWLAIEFPLVAGEEAEQARLERAAALRPIGLPEVPVLTRVMKRDRGPNLNHGLYPAVMQEYVANALTVIRRFPRVYLRAIARGTLIFLAPPTEHPAFRSNRRAIERWDRLYSQLIYGAADAAWPNRPSPANSRWAPLRELLGRCSWHYLVLGILIAVPDLVRRAKRPREAANAALLFAAFNLLFVVVAANLLEYGENNRFRMMVEPLIWLTLVVSISDLAGWCRRGMRRVLAERADNRSG